MELVQLATGKSKKGFFHIEHINNYHSRLKEFIRPFKGVATKYLNNYLVWYNLVEYAKETTTEKEQIFLSFVLTTQIDEKCRDISKRPPLPLVA